MSMDEHGKKPSVAINLKVEVATPAAGYKKKHLDFHINDREAMALAAIQAGMTGKPQKLLPTSPGGSGRFTNPNSPADALRLLLQRVADELKV